MMRYTYYCVSTHLYNDRRKQMGNFFTSSQIYNDKDLNKQQFIDKFCKSMSDSGYTVCDSDESEMSYILRFAEKSKWVAIASELYGEGGQIAQADAGRIAKMLGTYCMNTEVIDSDCAAMSLYSNDGKEADMLLMGRYDDYFGDDTPEPNEKIWAQFLSDGSTWEQFTEILSGNYVFVEDGLAQLAPVIGMDSGNLLFSAEDYVDDELAVFLDFKKAGAKKKLTINSAFKQVMGEALKPYGFKVIKGKQPYIVRVINNEILHIISFYSKDPDYPFDKAITIVCGIATVYRKRISLDLTPKQNRIWLKCYNNLGIPFMEKNGMTKKRLPSKSCYNSNDPESMIATLKTGAENLIKYVLPVFDEVKDIDSALDFAEDFGQPCNYIKCTKICEYYPDEDEAFLNFLSEKVLSKQYQFLDKYFNDSEFHKWVLVEIEKRKKENTEILKSLNLIN